MGLADVDLLGLGPQQKYDFFFFLSFFSVNKMRELNNAIQKDNVSTNSFATTTHLRPDSQNSQETEEKIMQYGIGVGMHSC